MALKHSVVVAGHRTSISLENSFWDALRLAAERRGTTIPALIAEIDRDREVNLSSAIRVFLLAEARAGRLGEGPEEAS
jgi:predicted DNA-binding ribbon-helix-helix protein